MSTPHKKNVHEREQDALRTEYDFSQAVRGTHYHPLHEGYTIKIHKTDGTTEVQQVMFEPGTIRIDPDVQAYFPDATSVNSALRSFISIMEHVPETTKKKRRTGTKKKTAPPQKVVESS
jgi:hypothetical protein